MRKLPKQLSEVLLLQKPMNIKTIKNENFVQIIDERDEVSLLLIHSHLCRVIQIYKALASDCTIHGVDNDHYILPDKKKESYGMLLIFLKMYVRDFNMFCIHLLSSMSSKFFSRMRKIEKLKIKRKR